MAELEDRVSRIERDHVSLDGRVAFAAQQVASMASVPTQIVRLESSIESLREAMKDMRREIAGISESVDDRAKEQSEERRALKVALLGLTGVIMAAVIGGVFVLLANK